MRCDPRSWSRRRLLRGFGLLALAGLAAWIATASAAAGLAAVALTALFDAACALVLRRLDPLRIRATLVARHRGAWGVVLVDDVVTLEAALSASATPLRTMLVTPAVPAGLDPAGPGGVLVSPEAACGTTAAFELRAVHAGTHVLPGLIVRQSSPLGLFARTEAVEARLALQVLPDFVSARGVSLGRALRRAFSTDRLRPAGVRGGGGEFLELRAYRAADPLQRIDWKASARRRDVLVREYEEPLEIQLQVVLDASLDMTHDSNERSRFHAAAKLVARLACAALVQEMSFRVTAYDEAPVLDTTVPAGGSGCLRVAAQVADLSRQSVLRRARETLLAPRAHAPLLLRLQRAWKWWRPDAPWPAGAPGELAEFAADVEAAAVRDEPARCPDCGLSVFPDEPGCPRCRRALGDGGLPRRASALAARLAEDRRGRAGPGFLILISSLHGGEPCDAIADLLARLAASGRRVHVIAPGLTRDDPAAPEPIGSLSQAPARRQVLADLDRVARDLRLRQFARRLRDAGVHWHEIDDDSDLEEVVTEVLLRAI